MFWNFSNINFGHCFSGALRVKIIMVVVFFNALINPFNSQVPDWL